MADSSNTGSSRSTAFNEQSSPYFLHHSDNPGLILVQPPLSGDNYASWSRAMLIALSVKNKLGFVNGTIPKPDGTDFDLLNSWFRNNNIVISWILNSVSKEISAGLLYTESACDMWNDLKEQFRQSNGPKIFQLKKALLNLNQNQTSVGAYFIKLKSLWEELTSFRPVCTCGKCTCGADKNLAEYFQKEYVMSFLMGLEESFSHVRTQLLLMDPIPPINKVFSLVSQEEQQRKIGTHTSFQTDPNANMAFAVKNYAPRPPGGNMNSPVRTPFPNNNQRYAGPSRGPKNEKFCTHCHYHGHTVDKCYKLHGYPPGFTFKQKGSSSQTRPNAAVNQVLAPSPASGHSSGDNTIKSPEIGQFMQSLDSSQYQQLLSMFSNHLISNDENSSVQNIQNSHTAYPTGDHQPEDDWQG